MGGPRAPVGPAGVGGLRPAAPLGYRLFLLYQTQNLPDPGRGLMVGAGQIPGALWSLEQDSPLCVSLCRDSGPEGLAATSAGPRPWGAKDFRGTRSVPSVSAPICPALTEGSALCFSP